MISMPWQIVVAVLALVGVSQLIHHLRRVDCDERIRAEKNQQHRDTMAVYRDAYTKGWRQGRNDGREGAGSEGEEVASGE